MSNCSSVFSSCCLIKVSEFSKSDIVCRNRIEFCSRSFKFSSSSAIRNLSCLKVSLKFFNFSITPACDQSNDDGATSNEQKHNNVSNPMTFCRHFTRSP